MKAIYALLLMLALTACATQGRLDEARKHYTEGRGEEALTLLERTTRENPNDRAARSEYFRIRDLVLAQWLGQAEVLRGSGQFELAEALYQRVQKYDPCNVRASAGVAQLATERRQQAPRNADGARMRSGNAAA